MLRQGATIVAYDETSPEGSLYEVTVLIGAVPGDFPGLLDFGLPELPNQLARLPSYFEEGELRAVGVVHIGRNRQVVPNPVTVWREAGVANGHKDSRRASIHFDSRHPPLESVPRLVLSNEQVLVGSVRNCVAGLVGSIPAEIGRVLIKVVLPYRLTAAIENSRLPLPGSGGGLNDFELILPSVPVGGEKAFRHLYLRLWVDRIHHYRAAFGGAHVSIWQDNGQLRRVPTVRDDRTVSGCPVPLDLLGYSSAARK